MPQVNPKAPATRIKDRIAALRHVVKEPSLHAQGRLLRMTGLSLEVAGIEEAIGARCLVVGKTGQIVDCEVAGFSGDITYMMPTDAVEGIGPGARVVPLGESQAAVVGEELLGRVIGGKGEPLDHKGPIIAADYYPLWSNAFNPLARIPIDKPLDVGIRSINALLTVGHGQRIGLFAGSGVGKSVLLGMMTRFTEADVIVVGLVGERGREVRDFIEKTLGGDGLARAIVVAAPSDRPPLVRMHAALRATAIAEYFRDQGRHVLLLMDSLTRFAQAQREVGLAIGEPPATKGYPPSVFSHIARLVERAGTGGKKGGSITAFYTVLVEGDDLQDPIADAARSVLDGHIVLSRSIADAGLYPAVDLAPSVSRLMPDLVDDTHLKWARFFREIYSKYMENRDLLAVGAYSPGNDPVLDLAVTAYPQLRRFLSQGMHEKASFAESKKALEELLAGLRNTRA